MRDTCPSATKVAVRHKNRYELLIASSYCALSCIYFAIIDLLTTITKKDIAW